MGRPRRINESDLLAAARRVFIARGAEATTREIADAAGVSQTLLFQRYRTKQELFFASMLPAAPSIDDLLGPAPDPGQDNARAHLLDLARRLLAWIDDAMPGALRAALHPDFPDALARTHGSDGGAAVIDGLAERLALLASRGDIASADAALTAKTLVELLHGQALATMTARSESISDRAERAVLVLWSGLCP